MIFGCYEFAKVFHSTSGFHQSMIFKNALKNKFPHSWLIMRRRFVFGTLFGLLHSLLYHSVLEPFNLHQTTKVFVSNSIVAFGIGCIATHSIYTHFFIQGIVLALSIIINMCYVNPDSQRWIQTLHTGVRFGELEEEERKRRK